MHLYLNIIEEKRKLLLRISIVIPIYNEEKNLPLLYERILKTFSATEYSIEIIFVYDCGQDNSLAIIKDLSQRDSRVKFIEFSRNFGHQIAISAGIEHAKGDAIIIMDGDLQDPPELLPSLIKKYKEGYEVVYAKRKKRDGVGFFKKLAYKMFYRILKTLSPIDIPLDTGDFRIIDRKMADVLNQMPEQEKFVRGQIAWAGFKQTSIEYDRDKRHSGEPGYTFSKLLKLAMDGIFSFSNMPLRIATVVGLFVSFISFLFIIWVVVQRFLHPNYDIQGWYSLMVSVLFLGGVQLISIGLIGEYISRMNSNMKNRPLYIVKDKNC